MNHRSDIQYYNADGIMPDNRTLFLKWYEQYQHDRFDFQKEKIKYCLSDVNILRRGCLKFRDIFMKMTSWDDREGFDNFKRYITIASVCNLVFRSLFLERIYRHWRTKKLCVYHRDPDGKINTCCKVKGITLNYMNSFDINFDTIKNMIGSNEESVVTVRNGYKIARD